MKNFKIRGSDALSVMKRFVKKIEVRDGCWVWTGAVNSKGYPMLWLNGSMVGAHVVAHELCVGRVTGGRQVHHECLNRRCVCPTHLHPVPPEVNRRMQTLGVGDLELCDVPF